MQLLEMNKMEFNACKEKDPENKTAPEKKQKRF